MALAAVLIAALLARGAAAHHYRYTPSTDTKDYDRHAVSIADGRGYPPASGFSGGTGPSAFRPPLYPYFLAGIYKLSGTADPAKRWSYGRYAQAVLGVVVVALIALIALQIWGRPESITAGAIAAVYPPLIFAGTSLLTEPLFLVLMLAGVSATLRYRKDSRWRWLILAGLCAGLCSLCRTNGVIVIVALAAGVWIVRPRFSRRALARPAALVLTGLAVVAPWTLRNAVELHAFVPLTTQNGFALAGQYNPVAGADRATWLPPFDVPQYRHVFFRKVDRPHEPPRFVSSGISEVELQSRLTDLAVNYAGDHPGHVLAATFWSTLRFFDLWNPVAMEREAARFSGEPPGLAQASVYAFWLLGVLAIAGCFTAAARRVPRFIWLIPILTLASVILVYGDSRYRLPAEPVFILLATAAVTTAWHRLRSRSRPPAVTA